ncbi:MAG: hypothetical protein CMB08_01045 [Euryarchaeota archaeon]|nr:hypothetical protein [Euryarchaeota archaeon]
MANSPSLIITVKSAKIALFLTMLLLAPVYSPINSNLEENKAINDTSYVSKNTNLYRLYFAEQNSNDSGGGDGTITTKVPDDGGQKTGSALDSSIEFTTPKLRSSIDFEARSSSEQSNYYVPLYLFIRASGPSGSSVEWTVILKASGSQIGSATFSADACVSGLTSSCGDFDYEIFSIDVGSRDVFTVSKDQRLEVIVDASMSGCDGGGLFSSCEAEVAWNEITGENRHSSIEVDANAISDSLIMVQREGSELIEGPEVTWYPNDIISERTMQFTFDVKSAFGRDDIADVKLLMRDPDGIYRIDKDIDSLDDEDIEDTSSGIFGKYLWTYPIGPNGLISGEYSVELEITDIQGHTTVIEHETIQMKQWGVALNHRFDRYVEFIAPGETTPIPLQLVHRGDSTKSMDVELNVQTPLGSSWQIEFDSPGGYTLDQGGDILNPILSLRAPDDLSRTPGKIKITAQAEALNDEGILTVVHSDLLELELEKIDVYQPPEISLWSEEHDIAIANSTRGDSIDPNIPRYVEYGEFNPFILEVFNTGFDADSFRIDILKRSKAIFQVFDNDTGNRILEDEGDGTFHIPLLERHSTQTLKFSVKPSDDREDEDIGQIELEIISEGNASLRSNILFTIQRTFGIRAEVSHDCDGTPLGQIEVSLCSSNSDNPTVDLRARITNTMENDQTSTQWRIQNPASLDKNLDINPVYGQWQFTVKDKDGVSVPRVTLGPDDYTEVFVSITLTDQVEAGNHTVYLRIIEDTEDPNPRYFDLPMIFEVGEGDPDLEIVQVSPISRFMPGDSYSIQMKVRNEANTPITVLLDSSVEETGWSITIEGKSGSPLIELDAFDEETFTVDLTVPEDANNGDRIPISITASPLDTEQSFSDDFTAKFELNAVIEISSISEIIINEITHPRFSTMIFALVAILIIFAGVQSRLNRRKWAAQIAYLEMISDDGKNDEPISQANDIPSPVLTIEEEIPDKYEQDDIELV